MTGRTQVVTLPSKGQEWLMWAAVLCGSLLVVGLWALFSVSVAGLVRSGCEPYNREFAKRDPAGLSILFAENERGGFASAAVVKLATAASFTRQGSAMASGTTMETPASNGEGFLPNLAGNPSFEAGIAGWGVFGDATLHRVVGGFHGSYALEVQGPQTRVRFGAQGIQVEPLQTSRAGAEYRASVWVRSTLQGGRAVLRLREVARGKEVGMATCTSVTLSKAWQLLRCNYVSLKSGSHLELQVLDDPARRGEVFQADNVTILMLPADEPLSEKRSRSVPPVPSKGDVS